MLTDEQIAAGWILVTDLTSMVGRPVIYRNASVNPAVQIEGWLDSLDEGWPVVEFSDNSRAVVRPSRIIAYRPETPNADTV